MVGLLMIFSGAGKVCAQSVVVPVDKQLPLLLKSISFDRNFGEKVENNKTIVIGIVYQEKYRRSVNLKDELIKATLSLENQELTKYEITYRLIPIDGGLTEDVRIKIQSSSIMYVTQLRGVDMEELGEISRANNVLSVAMVPEDCRSGLSMSFEQAGSRPKLLIHLRAARAEGCNFSSQLLKIANTF
jgi:hypothetical protein